MKPLEKWLYNAMSYFRQDPSLTSQWPVVSDSSRRAQVERHRAMHRRAFAKATPIGSENSPGMTILSIWLLAAEKTRRQDGREVAWP